MAGPSLNAYLGIAFLVTGTLATFLMYHCWGYPYDRKNHKSSAPESLVFLHRLLGYVYLGIYAYLMVQMVPRLWNYQVELPARTVVHLSCGMLIGAILFCKIMIVRFFKHLEGPLVPFLGTTLWLCTCLVVFLSIPFSMRETFLNRQALPDSAARAANLERVGTALQSIGLEDETLLDQLSSTNGLNVGRGILLNKCTACHDLRHVLARNRTASKWRSTVSRMAGLSTTLAPITEVEQWQVTAYLIAISPDLLETAKKKQQETRAAAKTKQALQSVLAQTSGATAVEKASLTDDPPVNISHPEPTLVPKNYNASVARRLYENKCSQCHGLEDVENYEFTDFADAEDVLTRMTTKPGFDATEKELAFMLHLLKMEFVQ